MSQIVSEIRCNNCGAPLNIQPGELLSTCRYCGYTMVVGADAAFQLEHSLITNNNDQAKVTDVLQDWMRTGFMKPGDLARKSKITLLELRYLPFWVIRLKASSNYEGILERMAPATPRKGTIENTYDWVVLGRRGTAFPTRDYQIPVAGKIPFDYAKIESYAKFLNSELSSDEAVKQAKDEVDDRQRFLARQDADKITSLTTDFEVEKPTYVHAPLWFGQYEYKERSYNAIIDGSTGEVLRADIPPAGF